MDSVAYPRPQDVGRNMYASSRESVVGVEAWCRRGREVVSWAERERRVIRPMKLAGGSSCVTVLEAGWTIS